MPAGCGNKEKLYQSSGHHLQAGKQPAGLHPEGAPVLEQRRLCNCNSVATVMLQWEERCSRLPASSSAESKNKCQSTPRLLGWAWKASLTLPRWLQPVVGSVQPTSICIACTWPSLPLTPVPGAIPFGAACPHPSRRHGVCPDL